jgi:diguanylate cyclase (GGDEF)-like protein
MAVICILASLWGSIGVFLYHDTRSAEALALQSTSNLVRAFEESTRRTISQIDQILRSARATHQIQGGGFSFDTWARDQVLPDKTTAAIGMADREGRVFADTVPVPPGTSIADRPHFLVQKDPAHDDLYISKPVHGRVSGRETIQFSRKLLGPAGEFAGVTVLSLDCEELSRFYQTLDLGGGFVALMSTDSTILAGGPLIKNIVGNPLEDKAALHDVTMQDGGFVHFTDRQSGTRFLVSYRHLREYPLVVMVGWDFDTIFKPHRLLQAKLSVAGIVLSLAVGAVGLLWVRQKSRGIASAGALDVTLETISQGILMADRRGEVQVINGRALDLLGLAAAGPGTRNRLAAAHAARLTARALPGSKQQEAYHRFDVTTDNGAILEVDFHHLPDGGFVQTFKDVTEQREAGTKVHYLVHHDPLTGLPNLAQLRERIPDYLTPGLRRDVATAFIMIDLDSFKNVNDALGHDVGDELLTAIAQRLQAELSERDFLARFGGDEFVILLGGLSDPDVASTLTERLLRRIAEPVQVGGHQLRIGASAGIAFSPRDGMETDILLKHADIALYQAKRVGRGTYRCFDQVMIQAVSERRMLESELRRALEGNELELHFQPQFACDTLDVVGVEALLRWRHPTGGYISPATFIPIAEECGLINQLGIWVLEQACVEAASWRPRCRVAVNVSVVQLRDGRLQDQIAAVLQRSGLPPDMLEIEVTESVIAEQDRVVLDALNSIRAIGVQVALDDFGTGYSSLSYLWRFPFDRIKIDKSFVQGQEHDTRIRVILETILTLCERLRLPVVCEGVETQQQLGTLRQFGCTDVQGYLLARPMPIGSLVEFLGRAVPRRYAGHLVQDEVMLT